MNETLLVELCKAAEQFVDDNFNNPTISDKIIIQNAFLRASQLTIDAITKEVTNGS